MLLALLQRQSQCVNWLSPFSCCKGHPEALTRAKSIELVLGAFRERKWKLAQAKKLVRKAATSENNLALRDGVRQREEATRIRKRASWISKEVRPFTCFPSVAFVLA